MDSDTLLKADKSKNIRIGVSIPIPDQEWTAGALFYARKAISDWSVRLPELNFELKMALTVEDQEVHIKSFIDEGFRWLVILPIESSKLTPLIKKARKAGVFVVDTDRGLLEGAHDVYISGDNYQYGKIAAQWMASELHEKGKIVVITGVPCKLDTIRMSGFHDAISKYPGIRILEEQIGYWNKGKSQVLMENFLQRFEQIDGVYSQDDGVQEAVIKAYKNSGRSDIRVFFGGTGQRNTIRKILEGDPLVRATVSYSPSLIATSVSFAVLTSIGKNFDGFYQTKVPSQVVMRSELITRENAKDYYDKDAEF